MSGWSGFPEKAGRTFVAVFSDEEGEYHLSIMTERGVSYMYDMADTGADDGLVAVYATNNDGGLCQVALGKSEPINQDQETPLEYAKAPLLITVGDTPQTVGYVIYTDH